jgi:hypothetical protein
MFRDVECKDDMVLMKAWMCVATKAHCRLPNVNYYMA